MDAMCADSGSSSSIQSRNHRRRTAMMAPRPAAAVNDPSPICSFAGPPDCCHISSYYAENFFGAEFARELMKDAGLFDDSNRPPVFISNIDFWMMCLASINLADDEGHGCLKQRMPKSTFSMIWASVNQMDTLGSGLKRFTELLPILRSGISASLGHSATTARLTFAIDDQVVNVERAERYLELNALVLHCMLLWGTGREIHPLSLRLSSRLEECDGSMASSLCDNRIRRGTGLTVTYRREDLALPLGLRRYKRWATPETSSFLEMLSNRSRVASSDRSDSIANELRRILAKDNLSQQQAADLLQMSVATLQRRLADTGDTFREISRETRKNKLSSLLATGGSLDDIAAELGFSERRSLWRACHDWLGMSPARYRDTHRQQAKAA